MPSQAHHIRRLAAALAAGPMEDREALVARAKPLVGDMRKARWLVPLARNLSLEFVGSPPRRTCGSTGFQIEEPFRVAGCRFGDALEHRLRAGGD